MRLLRGIQAASCLSSDTVATIGNFDGVHLGHQSLLTSLKTIASSKKLPTLVVLFEPQPYEYFKGKGAAFRLSSFREKWRLLEALQIDYVCCLPFNKALALMPAHDFAANIIFSKLRVKTLLIGEDFRFGAARSGDTSLLKQIATKMDASLEIYQDVLANQQRISSTRIRGLLETSELDEAKCLLGRAYSLSGRVVKGDARGRTFGVPTANIKLGRVARPLCGVFCVTVKRLSNGTIYNGVANIGKRPTVDGLTLSLEAHLLDFDDSLYGERLEVFFLHRLRGEVKFPSLQALIAQIKADITAARALFPRLIE